MIEAGCVGALWSGFVTVLIGYFQSVKVRNFVSCGAFPLIYASMGVLFYRHPLQVPQLLEDFLHRQGGISCPSWLNFSCLILPVLGVNSILLALQTGNVVKNIKPYFPRLISFIAGFFIAFNDSLRPRKEI